MAVAEAGGFTAGARRPGVVQSRLRRRTRLAELADETFADFPAVWGNREGVDSMFASPA